MISVAICDDNIIFLERLRTEIKKALTRYKIPHSIKIFSSGAEFLEQHGKAPFDTVFLDIKMPDINGFQVAEKLRHSSEKALIIFVTTEDTLVYDSFGFQPFDFIPKLPPESLNVPEGKDFMSLRIDNVIKRISHRLTAAEKICLEMPYGEKLLVPLEDILSVKTAGNYVEYTVKEHNPIRVRKKLDEAMEELDPKLFVRLHKSYAVNMGFIKKINYSELVVTLKDGSLLTVSRPRKKEVEAVYLEYLRNFGK